MTERLKDLEIALVIVTGGVVLYWFSRWEGLLVATGMVGLAVVFSPRLGGWISMLWMKLAVLLGKVIPVVLLALVYFLFLFPVAMLARLFRGDPLRLKIPGGQSFWIKREHFYTAGDLEKPW
jgi:hypothetical protein